MLPLTHLDTSCSTLELLRLINSTVTFDVLFTLYILASHSSDSILHVLLLTYGSGGNSAIFGPVFSLFFWLRCSKTSIE